MFEGDDHFLQNFEISEKRMDWIWNSEIEYSLKQIVPNVTM